MPKAPITMIQIGTVALLAISPNSALCRIAARGPMALATSFAPWAKDSRAAEQISGTRNKIRSDWFRFSIPSDWRRTIGRMISQTAAKTPMASGPTILGSGCQTCLRPLIAR